MRLSLFPSAARDCLVDTELTDFATGKLEKNALEAVQRHLDLCEGCQRLAGEAARALSVPPSGAGDLLRSTMFREGDLVAGRYEVRAFIGRGEMGEVYDAHDRELQARVALKTLVSMTADTQGALGRLKAEVRLARSVSHPNVCQIHGLGAHVFQGSGATLHFLTMAFVEGERLGERLRRNQLSTLQTQVVVRQLLAGLTAAHSAGVLHGDLKIESVILRPSAADALVPVIMDLGLGRRLEVDPAHVASGLNAFMGTPFYMSPEELEGTDLSKASDVYSLGVMWFEMLTGRLPFSPKAPFERLRKPPLRPRSIRKDVPASLERLVMGCLARKPEQRFSDAGEVLAALNALEALDRDSHWSDPSASREPGRWVIAAALLVATAFFALLLFGLR